MKIPAVGREFLLQSEVYLPFHYSEIDMTAHFNIAAAHLYLNYNLWTTVACFSIYVHY